MGRMKKILSKLMRQCERLTESILKRVCWKTHLEESILSLQRVSSELPTTEMILSLAYSFSGKGYFKSLELKQNMQELLLFVNMLKSHFLTTVCEIGTNKGGTLFIWCQIASPDAHIISIDLPGGQFGGGYHEKATAFLSSFSKPQQKLDLLRGNSHDPVIQSDFVSTLNGQTLDFLFIDGDHTYLGVKDDFEFYSRFVKNGGFIAFHDILIREEHPEIQVHRFWEEIKQKYEHYEFVDKSGNCRPIGIGVIVYRGK